MKRQFFGLAAPFFAGVAPYFRGDLDVAAIVPLGESERETNRLTLIGVAAVDFGVVGNDDDGFVFQIGRNVHGFLLY